MNRDTPVKKNVLILAANPEGTSSERTNQELRDIEDALQRSQMHDHFKLEKKLAVRPDDVRRAILDFKPNIIHFSGYSAGEEGLILENEIGKPQLVSGEALANLFALFSNQIECVVLNGCYSQIQAEEIAEHINYVIGMNKAIDNKAAKEFAVGFYDALGAGEPIERAYEVGCSSMRLSGVQKWEYSAPVLLKKTDIIAIKPQKQFLKKLWRRIPWHGVINLIPKSSMPITFAIIFLRLLGAFEASELWLYDQMMMLKLTEEPDKRLLIIQVTAKDIENDRGNKSNEPNTRASLSDKQYLKIFSKLTGNPQKKPRAIGLDIYRDFETKNSDLKKILANESNSIFGVCNIGDKSTNNYGVKPPSEFKHERLGFSDVWTDKGSAVRRQILFNPTPKDSLCVTRNTKGEKQPIQESFPLILAKHYFKDKKYSLKTSYLEIGDRIIEFLSSNGGYRGSYSMYMDFNKGYQILLNYRNVCSNNNCSIENVAHTVTVEDFLNKDDDDFENKIVLIGITDTSDRVDMWTTPFSSVSSKQIPGVILQAQMLSQILSAVEDKRPILQVWSLWQDMGWIFLWSLIGGTLAQIYKTRKSLLISGAIASGSLLIICFWMFIYPMSWIPFLPSLLGFLSTITVVLSIKSVFHRLKSSKHL